MKTGLRAVLRFGRILALLLVGVTGPAHAGTEPPRLVLSQPVRSGQQVVTDIGLRDLFDADLRATLRSGLPVSLEFQWTIWQERRGWSDLQVYSGQLQFRVFFDVLEEDYNIFNAQGRPLAACDALAGVQGVICNQEAFVLAGSRLFSPESSYHVEMEVIVKALTDHQVRGFESWLLDQVDSAVADSGEAVSSPGGDGSLTKDLPGVVLGLIKNIAGIRDRSTKSRSPSFRGWPQD